MTKQRDDITDLKRRLTLLDKLDAGAMVCADGVFLIDPGLVRDPRPIVKACDTGRPTSVALRAGMGPGAQPVAVGRELLAAAHRDLRAIEAAPQLKALAREAPRIFRRFGAIDEAWFAHKRARLALLAELLREHEAPPHEPVSQATPPWFSRVLDVIRLVHGDDAVLVVEDALGRIAAGARARRAEARRAVAEIIAGIEGRHEPESGAAIAAVRALREATRLSGRSRARRVATIMRELLGAREASDAHAGGEASLPLVEQVRAVGGRIVSSLDRPSSPAYFDRAYRFFALWALAFDPRPRDGGALVVRPEQIERGLEKLGDVIERLGGTKLRLPEALALLALDMSSWLEAHVTELVERGLPVANVQKLAALGRLEDLPEFDKDPRGAEAYTDWAVTLGAHYASLGLAVPITPKMFATFRGARREDLGVLAACLMKHHARAEPGGAEDAIARLDATLGLFRRRPIDAARVLAELTGTSPGAGRALFPELAAWLGDDALLDRMVHLLRLAGLPVAVSRSLRADFDRRAAQERERAHLAGMTARTPEQDERLGRLQRGEVEVPDPDKARRRLAERVRELHALAYEARLDAIFRGIVKEVWGISLGKLTPAWHDAVRFSFAIDDNRELLGAVLRAAAEGADLDRTRPANRAWIEEVQGRFDVDAWLAPRARDVTIAGATMRLAIERDPVEVLRMGIPFDTCLSLEGGSNSASTVVNAADANKRVIYLRDRAGKILARKLIAVSTDATLIGYHLYATAKEHRAEVELAFGEMCAEISRDARLPLSSSGEPKQIHAGFWYDDGTVPFTGGTVAESTALAYCEALGQPPPRVVSQALVREAAAFDALARGDAAAMKTAIGERWSVDGPQRRAARWLVAHAPPAELPELADRSTMLASVTGELAFERGPLAALELVGRLGNEGVAQRVYQGLARFPRTAELALASAAAGVAYRHRARRFEHEGFEHQTMYLAPWYAGEIPVAAALSICDRVESLWAYVAEEGDGCRDCKVSAEIQVIDAIQAGYARAPDPGAILRCLESARSSTFARRAAIRIAAVYALAEDAAPTGFPPPCMQPVRACAAAMRALARLRQRAPELEAEPDLFAALIRQSAGSLPRNVALPVPREPPFEALGDLLVQLDLERVLGPWLAVHGVASAWKPTRWEVYFHRRRRTARRIALAADAAARAPEGSPASDLLALLGDADAIAPLVPAEVEPTPKPPRARRGAQPKPRSPGGRTLQQASAIARDVTAQVVAADTGTPLTMPLAAIEMPLGLLKQDERAIDPGLLVAAFSAVRSHLAGAGDSSRIYVAFVILGMGRPPTKALHGLLAEVVSRPVLDDAEVDFVETFLRERMTYFTPELPPDLAIAVARHPPLRGALFTALARVADDHFDPALHALLDAARRAGGDELEEIMLDGIVRATLARKAPASIAHLGDDALFRRAVALALDGVSVSVALTIYQDIASHERAAIFLKELAKSPLRAAPATRAAVEALRPWGGGAQHVVAYEWLVQAVRKRPARVEA